MFGLFQSTPESVHFIDMREGRISFLLTQPKRAGATMKVRFPLLPQAQTRRLDVAVTVTACRAARGASGFICVAEPQMSPQDTAKLAETLSQYGVSEAAATLGEVRQTDRSRISLRVLGREIPYFRAVALDLSPGGVRVHCQGKLAAGKLLEVKLELDLPSLPALTVQARVAWTLTNPDDSTFTSGLQFVDLSVHQRKVVDLYLAGVGKRDFGQVQHRLSKE
jgi:hypothetical protein